MREEKQVMSAHDMPFQVSTSGKYLLYNCRILCPHWNNVRCLVWLVQSMMIDDIRAKGMIPVHFRSNLQSDFIERTSLGVLNSRPSWPEGDWVLCRDEVTRAPNI